MENALSVDAVAISLGQHKSVLSLVGLLYPSCEQISISVVSECVLPFLDLLCVWNQLMFTRRIKTKRPFRSLIL